jgi:tRNA A-37 threonylcarbamoyl transferase component Bud32
MSAGRSSILHFPRTIEPREERTGPSLGDIVASGHYALVDRLGEGGLGTVFLAKDIAKGHEVALKTLIPRYIGRPERERRLFDEFSYLERVTDHRHVVAGIECGRLPEFDGWPFLVMEHVAGGSLFRRMLRDPALTPSETIDIGLQVARGIQAIHRARVVHRDITPQNILLSERGDRSRVKIIDFSHGADANGPRLAAGQHGRLTGMHEVPGTAQYMPPEQASSMAADPRMDIYSFGVVLYEMITGSNPFAGMSREVYIELQRRDGLQAEPIDPRVYPELPASLLRLVSRCMHARPAGRPSIEQIIRRFAALEGELDGDVHRFESARTQPRLVRPMSVVGAPGEHAAVLTVVGEGEEPAVVEAIETPVVVEAPTVVEVAVVHGDAADHRVWFVAAAVVLVVAIVIVTWMWLGDRRPVDPPQPSAPPTEVAPPAVVPPALDERRQASAEPDAKAPSSPEPTRGAKVVEDGPPDPEASPAVDERTIGRAAPPPSTNVELSPAPHGQRKTPAAAGASGKAKTRCAGVVDAAKAAQAKRNWTLVVKHTSDPTCWDSAPVDRLAFRAEALAELGRWAECARIGAQSKAPQVQAWTESCRARSELHEDAP